MFKLLLGWVVLAVLAGCETMPRQVLPYVMDDGAGGTDLYLYDLESGASSRLTQTPGIDEFDPCVDPTGTKIVYLTKRTDLGPNDIRYGLFVHDLQDLLDSGDRDYITRSNRLFSPVWSNNGKSIAYVEQRDGKLQIEVRELNTGKKAKTIGFGCDPSWRVDDKAIFYNSRDTLAAEAGDLTVHELKTGINQSLRLRGNDFTNLARGTSVVYTALPYSRRNQAIWIIDANNQQKRLSSPGKTHRDTDPVHINGTKFVAFTRTDIATNKSSIYVVERYAKDPVETQLFEAKGNTYTQGTTSR